MKTKIRQYIAELERGIPGAVTINTATARGILGLLKRQAEIEGEPAEVRGIYECFHCGARAVVWGADFSFDDYGREGEGIVHTLTCDNCGAEIEYYIQTGDDQE